MTTLTLSPRSLVRIGLAMVLPVLLTLLLLSLGAPGAAAVSLVSTSDAADTEQARESELLRVMLATTDGPLTVRQLLFIEHIAVLPGITMEPSRMPTVKPVARKRIRRTGTRRSKSWMATVDVVG